VRATFFLVGKLCADRPGDVGEVASRGHEIGGHGYTHTPFSQLGRGALLAELERTAALLPATTTSRRLVRPPHGAVSVRSLHTTASAGFTTVLWSYDSNDCRTRDAAALCRGFREKPVIAGDIVLLHEGQPWTLQTLPALIEALVEAGHELCTVSELIDA
jgi:peptidoglycan/xylan/chitin deacetylase (PgdA/CDA1 family)